MVEPNPGRRQIRLEPTSPASAYGADRKIPITYRSVPAGFAEAWAPDAELVEAGFLRAAHGEDKPGQQPLDEMLVAGSQMIDPEVAAQLMRHARFRVLRNPEDKIVATWDEGRWWTPAESAEFLPQLVVEMQRDEDAAK